MTWTEIPAAYMDRPTAQQLANKTRPELSAEDIAENERGRASRRERKKQEIAAAIHAEQEWARLNTMYEVDIPQRKEALSAEHCQSAAPLQARLTEIEAKIINGIKERQPTDSELEAERTELLSKLQQMNADLKAAIDREDGIAAEIFKQRQTAGDKSLRSSLENELLHLASPALQLALQLAQSSTRWAEARLTRAGERLYEKRTAFNVAEHKFASDEVARTKQLEQAAYQACLDE